MKCPTPMSPSCQKAVVPVLYHQAVNLEKDAGAAGVGFHPGGSARACAAAIAPVACGLFWRGLCLQQVGCKTQEGDEAMRGGCRGYRAQENSLPHRVQCSVNDKCVEDPIA
eukprot:scaffold141369_cov23-Tisochrysis_lutea.AAC.2